MRYAIEWVRHGVVVAQRPVATTRARARQFARVFAARRPAPVVTWGVTTGWMVRVLDRRTGLIVTAYENVPGNDKPGRVRVIA